MVIFVCKNGVLPGGAGLANRPLTPCVQRNRCPFLALALLIWLLLLPACVTWPGPQPASRRFDFASDTFAYPNELKWEYAWNSNGEWVSHRREPPPGYALHCFVVARSARQFFEFARFDPHEPVASEAAYRRTIREVLSREPRTSRRNSARIVIPGYPSLRSFSEAHETLLKDECGGAFQSYIQRGNWRMVFPVSRKHQEEVADRLLEHLTGNHTPIVHLFTFPQLGINHAMLVFDGATNLTRIDFACYDPNQPEAPVTITFDRRTRTFLLPPSSYFPGGRVDAYEVYWKWNY